MTIARTSSGAAAVPIWVAVASVMISACLSLVADRIGMATSESSLEIRVQSLEKESDIDRQIIDSINIKLGQLLEGQGALRLNIQVLTDRQDEVRRKLKISAGALTGEPQ